MELLKRIINIGISDDTDEFKAARIRTFNRILVIFFVSYIGTIPIGFILGAPFIVIALIIYTIGLLPCFYLVEKQNTKLSRYLLSLNAWVLVGSLTIYLGINSGHIYTLFTASVLWFIIYNKRVELIIVESVNLLVFIGLVWYSFNYPPIWEGNQELLAPIRLSLIGLSIVVTMITIAFFKTNNYKFLAIVQKQKKIIETRQEEIEASIRYAKNIQYGILPNEVEIDHFAKENFIFFKPKDHVSGDMFWTGEQDGKRFLALGDCTGHGVPGAMVSIMGLTSLQSIIRNKSIKNPADLLHELDHDFNNKMRRSNLRDGMDITVLMHDIVKDEWSFASANSSIIVVSGSGMELLKGDRKPIGISQAVIKGFEGFKNYKLELKKDDFIYLFSDGFRDQFGGIKGKKYGIKRFQELLAQISKLTVKDQVAILEKELNDWKSNLEQIDDISLIGVRYT